MKPAFRLALLAAFALPVASPASDAHGRSCYSIWAEADGSGSSYRHFVYVENDCEDWLQCTAWTDVNPQPPKMLSVAPGATEYAETNSRSEYDDPRGFGSCHRK